MFKHSMQSTTVPYNKVLYTHHSLHTEFGRCDVVKEFKKTKPNLFRQLPSTACKSGQSIKPGFRFAFYTYYRNNFKCSANGNAKAYFYVCNGYCCACCADHQLLLLLQRSWSPRINQRRRLETVVRSCPASSSSSTSACVVVPKAPCYFPVNLYLYIHKSSVPSQNWCWVLYTSNSFLLHSRTRGEHVSLLVCAVWRVLLRRDAGVPIRLKTLFVCEKSSFKACSIAEEQQLWMRLESGHEQESIVAGAHWKTKVASNEIESTRLCVFRPIIFQYGIGLG